MNNREDPLSNFVVEVVDEDFDSIVDEIYFSGDERALKKGLDIDGFNHGEVFELNSDDEIFLKNYFNVIDLESRFKKKIRKRCSIDELPYKVHTGRELILMLSGEKPLAVFTDGMENIYFQKYVATNIFVKEVFDSCENSGGKSVRFVFFALPNQTWRIEAYKLYIRLLNELGWSPALEWMQGSLLGYDDSQMRVHMDILGKSNPFEHFKNA